SVGARARELRIDILADTGISDVGGRLAVDGAVLSSGKRLACDIVAISGGWSPAVHLTSHTGIKPGYAEDIAAFVPGGFAKGQFGAGALVGAFDTARAIEDGIAGAWHAVRHAGFEPANLALAAPALDEPAYAIEPAWEAQQAARRQAV